MQGTWLGVTTDGRLAVLTNFREETISEENSVSRGEMVNAFLTAQKEDVADIEQFVKRLISGKAARGSGGFSLVCGRVGQPLAVVSNRMQTTGDVKWIGKDGTGETVGLSNAAFGDHTWPKVVQGEEKMDTLMEDWLKEDASRSEIFQDLFGLLSTDTLVIPDEEGKSVPPGTSLRNSIFVPKVALGGEAEAVKLTATSGPYGTQKQTVVIVDRQGHLYYTEKTLYDKNGDATGGRADSIRSFDFQIS